MGIPRHSPPTLRTMPGSFEELDYSTCALGELILRRRRPVSMPDTWVYEVRLNGNFLMSSLVPTSEEALAHLALSHLDGPRSRVLVGGLGLGYTAAAALEHDGIEVLEIVEFLPEVIAWHDRGLVPLGSVLTGDPRVRIVRDDCFARLRDSSRTGLDAILIDIDDGPEEVLSADHSWFYSADGLSAARDCLRPGGVFGLWTSRPANLEFLGRLQEVFDSAGVEEVVFDNRLLMVEETNAIYLATA